MESPKDQSFPEHPLSPSCSWKSQFDPLYANELRCMHRKDAVGDQSSSTYRSHLLETLAQLLVWLLFILYIYPTVKISEHMNPCSMTKHHLLELHKRDIISFHAMVGTESISHMFANWLVILLLFSFVFTLLKMPRHLEKCFEMWNSVILATTLDLSY